MQVARKSWHRGRRTTLQAIQTRSPAGGTINIMDRFNILSMNKSHGAIIVIVVNCEVVQTWLRNYTLFDQMNTTLSSIRFPMN